MHEQTAPDVIPEDLHSHNHGHEDHGHSHEHGHTCTAQCDHLHAGEHVDTHEHVDGCCGNHSVAEAANHVDEHIHTGDHCCGRSPHEQATAYIDQKRSSEQDERSFIQMMRRHEQGMQKAPTLATNETESINAVTIEPTVTVPDEVVVVVRHKKHDLTPLPVAQSNMPKPPATSAVEQIPLVMPPAALETTSKVSESPLPAASSPETSDTNTAPTVEQIVDVEPAPEVDSSEEVIKPIPKPQVPSSVHEYQPPVVAVHIAPHSEAAEPVADIAQETVIQPAVDFEAYETEIAAAPSLETNEDIFKTPVKTESLPTIPGQAEIDTAEPMVREIVQLLDSEQTIGNFEETSKLPARVEAAIAALMPTQAIELLQYIDNNVNTIPPAMYERIREIATAGVWREHTLLSSSNNSADSTSVAQLLMHLLPLRRLLYQLG